MFFLRQLPKPIYKLGTCWRAVNFKGKCVLKRLTLGCFILILSACASQAPVKPGQNASTQGISDNPRIALRQLESRLASADEAQQAQIRLRLADLQLQQQDIKSAGQSLAAVDRKQLTTHDRVLLMCVKADYLSANDKAREAVKFLPKNQVSFPPELQLRVLNSQVRVLSAAGYKIEASHARIQLQSHLIELEPQAENAKSILNSLSALPGQSLQQLADKHLSADMDRWVAFVIATKPQLFSLTGFDSAVANWAALHPQHSIPLSVIEEIRSNIQSKADYPEKIALLLPLSSQFARQAASIRDGFLAAYYSYAGEDKPEIFIVDNSVAEQTVEQQLLFAQQQGAGLVVGPLLKSSIQAVEQLQQLPLPVLALNYLDEAASDDESKPSKSGFFQFGLLPEDEAKQAAKLALLRNQNKAALMVPKTRLGQRMAAAFSKAYTEQGGTVLSVQEYAPQGKDFSSTIKSMLNVQQSLSRKSILQAVLARNVEFAPRIRQDIDVIYMVAPPSQARGIKPQLKFFDAGDIAVLASSQVFNGNTNPSLDKDINDVVFTQTPWLLKADAMPLHQQLKKLWPVDMARNSKLFALGADAFKLVPFLERMQGDNSFYKDGFTGTLSSDNTGRIHRELLWARFSKGLVQLEDTTVLEMESVPATEDEKAPATTELN